VSTAARPGDVVAIMSNGGFGGIHEKLLEALRLNAPPPASSPTRGEDG
jgi:UDP-N-acetylmuramate: L-alanyl-gamma-D-glutamyl-meso-diaminopimelate ligase